MELIKYLPSFYVDSKEVLNIQKSIEIENDELQLAIKDLLDQLFVPTATWGLDYWERYLHIEVDRTEAYENRRSRVMTRLRGQGTITKEMIKNVCRSFVGGEVEVIEDNANYTFIIRFIDTRGIPANLNYLKDALQEIKPAHLKVLYRFKYLVISEMNTIRIADLNTMTINDFKNYQ